jgi:hypothetical protein
MPFPSFGSARADSFEARMQRARKDGDARGTREAKLFRLATSGVFQHEPALNSRRRVHHSFTVDRAWFRFSFQWPDPKTGEKQSRAEMQSYRIEDGKLVETWITMRPLGTSWTDVAQQRWTSHKQQ